MPSIIKGEKSMFIYNIYVYQDILARCNQKSFYVTQYFVYSICAYFQFHAINYSAYATFQYCF